eukprot:9749790-Ditylum_brightwellii.AAC.1
MQLHATADILVVAFYYLLHPGEYTKPRQVKYNGAWKKQHAPASSMCKTWGSSKKESFSSAQPC